MALPAQTFGTLPDLINYINTFFIPNGRKEIDGTEGNNILNSLAQYIPFYTVNAVGGGAIVSGGGAVTLGKPVNVITNTTPTSITWPDNVQKEYYITSTLGTTINNVKTYYDTSMVAKNTIPPKASLHIAQMTNGNWVQVAVANPGSGGSGGGNGQGNLF